MNILELFVFILFTYLLSSYFTHGWFFEQNHKPRTLDGSLRCFQCNTSEEKQGPARLLLCGLRNWKHANHSEKRNMIMQCPRRQSAFCHLVLKQGTEHAVRGCSGPNYTTGQAAHIGCFSMTDPNGTFNNRVCLCDTNLCNRSSGLLFNIYCMIPLVLCLKYFI